MNELLASDLVLGYSRETVVVQDVTLRIPSGSFLALVGPNGCGKSTLLRALGRILIPHSGLVTLNETSLQELPTLEIARHLGILPQAPIAPDGLSVRDLVLLGRSPYRRWWQSATREDREIAEKAMGSAEVLSLAEREVNHLSGGQRQRAWIAMALAQQTSTLLLDEPTTFLDMAHQLEVLTLLESLHRNSGRTIVMVLHDLNHAARFADTIVMMKEGRIVHVGPPEKTIIPERIREIFDIECTVSVDPSTGCRYCIPLRSVAGETGAGH